MDPYVELAKKAIEAYIRTGEMISVPVNLPDDFLNKTAGVFVSLHKQDNSLRGCIGTFAPTKINLAQEIISNAISAASKDPRFVPLIKNDLYGLQISVDVLSKPEPIESPNSLDPKKYGLLVKALDGRTGLLLPDIEGVETATEQLSICFEKAGILGNEKNVSLSRFTVERHK